MYINLGLLPLSSQSSKQSSQHTLSFSPYFSWLFLSFARSLLTLTTQCGAKTRSSHHYARRQAKTTSAREVFACRHVLWGVWEFLSVYIYERFFLLYFISFRMVLSRFQFSLLNRYLFFSATLPCDSLRPSKEGLQAAAFAACV